MTLTNRVPILIFLPLIFFGAGILSAGLAITAVKRIAPEPATLLDAMVVGQDQAIFRMISTGNDPGLPGVLDRPVYHWQRGDTTSPLLVAIGGGDINMVAYMARHTQRIADSPNDQALCVVARYGHSNIARFLMKMGVPAVPKNGCGELERPEDIAAKYRSGQLSLELRQYRIEAR